MGLALSSYAKKMQSCAHPLTIPVDSYLERNLPTVSLFAISPSDFQDPFAIDLRRFLTRVNFRKIAKQCHYCVAHACGQMEVKRSF